MTTARWGKPYVWVTWLTGILAGEDACTYAPWFKAHYKFDKVEREGFSLDTWKAEHAILVNARAEELRADGWTVGIEDQNAFRLHGTSAILAGKPDLLATRGPDVLVVDCKGGKKRGSDLQQVLIYLAAGPKAFAHLAGLRWRGEVEYRAERLPVPIELLTGDVAARIWALVRQVGASEALTKVPSLRECAFCDLAKSDCPERMQTEAEPVMVSEF